MRGVHLGVDFSPEIGGSGEGLNTDRFHKLLAGAGFQVLGSVECGNPQAQNARAWTEYGEFDDLGHKLQSNLAAQIDSQLERLLERIQALLDAGWKRVWVVTDHGWLLMPGGMPKVDMPKYLTESRWSRCAVIKDGSHVTLPIAGWSWNPQEWFAFATGAAAFVAGQEYAHGGVSLQECMTPVLAINSARSSIGIIIKDCVVQWVGMRCRISITPPVQGLCADLRTKPNVPSSSVTEPKATDADGKAALLVEDDSLEGTTVSVIIADAAGNMIHKQATTIGGDE